MVFFRQEGDYLIPECQISAKKYPQILPHQLQLSLLKNPYVMIGFKENSELVKNQRSSSTNNNMMVLNLLDECEPQLSLTLVDSAKYFKCTLK